MGVCDRNKKNAEQKCRDDDGNRRGLLGGLCDNHNNGV